MSILVIFVCYLLGSIPAAAWVARLHGIDIRTVGSGNSGATNVLRSVGKGPALGVALFDILKGALAVYIGRWLGLDEFSAALCGVAAFLGHNFSVFLGFRGGKGVATGFGTVVAIVPMVGFFSLALALVCMWLTYYVSAGSIIGGLAAILFGIMAAPPRPVLMVVMALGAFVVWQHRGNIVKLRAGTERKLGEKV